MIPKVEIKFGMCVRYVTWYLISDNLIMFQICNFVQNEGWTVMQTKPGSAGPYAYKGDQWVSYDDLDMIRNKVKEKSELIATIP